jgi:hypothetical protein
VRYHVLSILLLLIILISRAFNEILKADRAKYGADEEYEIADTIADEWQQRVDDAVAGGV